jgi:hypothetical protein
MKRIKVEKEFIAEQLRDELLESLSHLETWPLYGDSDAPEMGAFVGVPDDISPEDEAAVQLAIDNHVKSHGSDNDYREEKEAERIAELLARHPEAIEKIETELERRKQER